MRRRSLLKVAATATLLPLAGCAGKAATSTAAITVKHAHGAAVIPQAPQRIVALGMADLQIAQALGGTIVGKVANPGNPHGDWPGVSPPLANSVLTMAGTEPDLERIASLRPDLILITSAYPSFDQAYPKLSRIAPTVANRKGILRDSGVDLVRMIGAALDKNQQAQQLIDKADRQLQDFAAQRKSLRGKTFAFGQFVNGTTMIVVDKDAPSRELVARCGLSLPPELAALPVTQTPGVTPLSPEKLALLDKADVVILGTPTAKDRARFLAQPVVSQGKLRQKIRFLSTDETALILEPNPASMGAVLPLLDKVLKGLLHA